MPLLFPIVVYSEYLTPIVPDEYLIYKDKNISYVYPKGYSEKVSDIKGYQGEIINRYEGEFGFKFDDRLRVNLASQNNQVANGFSTQIPFNLEVLYGAGAINIDYFCFSSWFKTLLIHETAHNFQLNPKFNPLSSISHKILGNNPFTYIGLFPIFPIPNIMINSFLLEGNAVLNESRFHNGGRLYSGYALAELVLMAQADKIKPELMYNSTLEFPYGEKSYLIGGFFQKFLAEKYGVTKVNGYFKRHSKQLFPFFVDETFQAYFGKTFPQLLKEFQDEVKLKYRDFNSTKGKILAKSQFFIPMGSSKTEIYALIGDLKSYPKIWELNKSQKSSKLMEGAYRGGKPFKLNGKYYTLSSVKTSPTKLKMGLVDSEGYILAGMEGKGVQGFLPNGKAVYMDINSSIESPQIYIDGEFYDTAHSSVFVDEHGDIYYFKQQNETRTLFKNRKPLFSYQGNYGFVTDVYRDGIYFIARSKNGSTGYIYTQGKIYRAVRGDDIIDIKPLNGSEAVVTTIGRDGYNYILAKLNPKPAQVYPTEYLPQIDIGVKSSTTPLNSQEYNPLRELEFSSLNQAFNYDEFNGFAFDLKANFSDPFMQNYLSTYILGDKKRVIGGVSYANMAHQIQFEGNIYGVSHDKEYNIQDEDDYGYSMELKLPFLAQGYYRGEASLKYMKRYDSIYRKFLTLSSDISNVKHFGISKYPNSLNALNLFISDDRDNLIYGVSYRWLYGVPYQIFIGFEGSYMVSENVDWCREKGIEVDDGWQDIGQEKGKVIMPTLNGTLYTDKLQTLEVSISKTLDIPLYFYSFPLSIQRETIYTKGKFYNIGFGYENREFYETTLGFEGDFVLFNNFVLPIKFEYLYNGDMEDKSLFRVMTGIQF